MIRPLSLVLAVVAAAVPAVPSPPPAAPPNAPATVALDGTRVVLRYGDQSVLDASVEVTGGPPDVRRFVETTGNAVTQVIKWTAAAGGRIVLTGTVAASPEAFAAAVEPRPEGRAIVRSAVGPVVSALNRGVYDRRFDWTLSVDFPAAAAVTPEAPSASASRFDLTASGEQVALRFRPRFYQQHRHLSEYRPWTYTPWSGSVAGWTSWYAFKAAVTERDIHRTADVMAERLRPYGYTYLQIDDGYQQSPVGLPAHWLQTNERFPGGLQALERSIAARGLEPGLWTNVSVQDADAAEAHPSWFVRTADGRPARGQWIGYVMNGASRQAMDALVRPVYSALRSMGWSYVKLDALRHLRYEGYNSFKGFFDRQGLDREQVYRSVVSTVRTLLGRQTYLLACWGVRPELVGLVDGVRVGDDGFGYGAFAQYNSFNNVVWRNDPDHIEIGQPDGYRAATLATVTGSVLMLTDRPEVYETDRVEAARRTAPVLDTRPGQIYDVDPTRSSRIGEVGSQVSGAGPRPMDADKRLVVPLYQLDIARPFEQWTVLARTSGSDGAVDLRDLGLASGRDYVGFEFWTRTPLGIVRDVLNPPPMNATYLVQSICLRPRQDHPQVLATNRHVTCGGPDLLDVAWRGTDLEGASTVVNDDDYVLYLTEPPGYRLASVSADGATAADEGVRAGTRQVRLTGGSGRVSWHVKYDHEQ
jgi:hypothetical protein